MTSNIEKVTHLSILLLCVTVSAVLIKKHFLTAATASPSIESGDILALPEQAGLAHTEKTLVIALSPDCRFCTESMPFYQDLIERKTAAKSDLRVVALVENPDRLSQEQRFLQEAGVDDDSLLSVDFQSIRIAGTPTLILVDRQGEALHVWKGKLTEEGQAQVYRSLDFSASKPD